MFKSSRAGGPRGGLRLRSLGRTLDGGSRRLDVLDVAFVARLGRCGARAPHLPVEDEQRERDRTPGARIDEGELRLVRPRPAVRASVRVQSSPSAACATMVIKTLPPVWTKSQV
jgi:hypothetical protein